MLDGAGDVIRIHATNQDLTFAAANMVSAPVSLANAAISGTVPYVVSGNRIASVDPTSFGLQDRVLMDFTRSLSGLIASAPVAAAGGLKDPDAVSVTAANGLNSWAKGFYGLRVQQGDALSARSVSDFSGGAFGVDGAAAPGWRAGLLAGGGAIQTSIHDAGDAKSDIGFGGLYGRYDQGLVFADASVIGGGLSNSSTRPIDNNLLASGIETASATFGGWFLTSEAGAGRRFALDPAWTLTPALRLRVLAAGFEDYSETGSASNLSVEARTFADVEERAELTLAKTETLDRGGVLLASVHAGVLGLERAGGSDVYATLLGKALTFAAPGRDAVAGVYAGAAFDLRLTNGLSAFASGEFTATQDPATLVAVKAGLRWRF